MALCEHCRRVIARRQKAAHEYPTQEQLEKAFDVAVLIARTTRIAIVGRGRHQELAFRRQVVMFLLCSTGASTTKIGAVMQRDHSSVISGRDVILRDYKAGTRDVPKMKERFDILLGAPTCVGQAQDVAA